MYFLPAGIFDEHDDHADISCRTTHASNTRIPRLSRQHSFGVFSFSIDDRESCIKVMDNFGGSKFSADLEFQQSFPFHTSPVTSYSSMTSGVAPSKVRIESGTKRRKNKTKRQTSKWKDAEVMNKNMADEFPVDYKTPEKLATSRNSSPTLKSIGKARNVHCFKTKGAPAIRKLQSFLDLDHDHISGSSMSSEIPPARTFLEYVFIYFRSPVKFCKAFLFDLCLSITASILLCLGLSYLFWVLPQADNLEQWTRLAIVNNMSLS